MKEKLRSQIERAGGALARAAGLAGRWWRRLKPGPGRAKTRWPFENSLAPRRGQRPDRGEKDKHITLMLVPHGGRARVHSLVLSRWVLRLAFGVGVGILVLAVGLGIFLKQAQNEIARLESLRQVNQQQAQALAEMENKAQQAEQQLEKVKELDQRVRSLLKLAPAPPSVPNAADRSDLSSRSQPPGLGGALRKDWLRGNDQAGAARQQLELLDQTWQDVQLDAQAQTSNLALLEKQVKAKLKYLACLPTAWPLSGRITSPYGWRDSPFGSRRQEFHDGLDIAAPWGTLVTAAGDGVVVYAGWKPGYGRMVTIDHGYGYRSSYGHGSSLLVQVGERVRRGTPIARVGSSGRSTGPHVHFMVEIQGQTVDPLGILD